MTEGVETELDVRVFDRPDAVPGALAERFAAIADAAVEEHGAFRVALSGGSTPRALYRTLASDPYADRIPWSETELFWGDERWVPFDHPDSNYGMVRELLLDRVEVPDRRIHPVPTDADDPATGAVRYEEELREVFSLPLEGLPRFDLVLLGLGADGHTASLYPGSPGLYHRERLAVAVEPPEDLETPSHPRVTLTLEVLNAARNVAFLVIGSEKAEAVNRVLRTGSELPAAQVRPRGGELVWYLDLEAAAKIRSGSEEDGK